MFFAVLGMDINSNVGLHWLFQLIEGIEIAIVERDLLVCSSVMMYEVGAC